VAQLSPTSECDIVAQLSLKAERPDWLTDPYGGQAATTTVRLDLLAKVRPAKMALFFSAQPVEAVDISAGRGGVPRLGSLYEHFP
jgi:hypothetical protein